MPGNKMGEQTKEKILLAAQQEFLENGFETARMEDIARRAGITKAMLYYHFNAKENIFNEMVKRWVAEVRQNFLAVMAPAGRNDPALFRQHLQSMAAFYAQHQAIIRLILARQLNRPSQEAEGQLSIFKEIFELILELAGENPQRDQEEFLIRLFFFNTLPMLLYASLSDPFCADFNVSPEKCLEVFTDTFTRSFFASAGPKA